MSLFVSEANRETGARNFAIKELNKQGKGVGEDGRVTVMSTSGTGETFPGTIVGTKRDTNNPGSILFKVRLDDGGEPKDFPASNIKSLDKGGRRRRHKTRKGGRKSRKTRRNLRRK